MAYTKKTSFPTLPECHTVYTQAWQYGGHHHGLEALHARFVDRDAEAVALLKEARRYILDLYGSADLPADMRKDSVLARIESLLSTADLPVSPPARAPFRFARTYMDNKILADHVNMEIVESTLNSVLDRLDVLEEKERTRG